MAPTNEDMSEIATLYVEELADAWTEGRQLPDMSMSIVRDLREKLSWSLGDCERLLRDYIVCEHLDELRIIGYQYYGEAALSFEGAR